MGPIYEVAGVSGLAIEAFQAVGNKSSKFAAFRSVHSTMRILVDLPQSDLALVDQLARRHGVSRAEFIRNAISASLRPWRRKMDHTAFGSWSNLPEDSLAYQERMRAAW